jgi:cellulose synthase/poly-beta-1,6-N-acetylglucosamine synthase-like glycosyltransferase
LGVDAPALTVLVPSYKEELSVIRQTLLSAALQEYPHKRIVLLLDDPPSPKSRGEQAALWAARSLPFDLQTLLAAPSRHVTAALALFRSRPSNNRKALKEECECIAECLRWVAEWFETQAKATLIQSHMDAWFVEHILSQPAHACRDLAAQWMMRTHHLPDIQDEKLRQHIDDAYSQLAGRFTVEFDVFERKQYCNLSHERNKAMNLNSFLGLMGKRVNPVLRKDGLHLEETSKRHGSRVIPDTPYVITLDADSLLQPRYAATLVRFMEQPEHARVAVAQTPYSAFPNPPGILERTAGATTDIQYLVHQGFTRFGATFWVGANALLKKSALEDICTEERDGAKTVRRYIHDRTVIEDTESTVDLMAKGWSLYNHPERLAYSATPPDFGSLVIQRARWANGGLIIFPKLLSFLRGSRKRPQTFVQAMLQTHYLTSLAFAPLSVLLLLVIPFSSDLMSIWMPLAAFPYFALYARDLAFVGYRPIRDLVRVYALNLLLIPVHLTGAVTSMRQAIAGTKIPFKRTPKVSGRTRTSGLDAVLQLLIVGMSAALGIFYVSQLRWISGMFALGNAALLLYGIKQFIGFAELREDIFLSVREEMKNAACHQATAVWRQWTASCTDFLRLTASQTLRVGSRHAALILVLTIEGLSPSLVGGVDRLPTTIALENQRPGTADWTLKKPALHREIEGYASATSVDQGESIRIYVNTVAPAYRLSIYRMGWYGGLGARLVSGPMNYEGYQQPAPFHDAETGLIECHWDHPITISIPPRGAGDGAWVSGYYLAKLTAEQTGEESYVLFVVRDDSRPSTYLVQASVTTFQAYNNWGGRSLYAFNSPGGQAAKVSFDRPYAGHPLRDAASGTGAGDFLVSNSIPPGAAASPAGWEYNTVRWLEKEGLDVTYATNIDVHRSESLLASHSAFLSIGHDEYWTWEMRRNIERARDLGTHLAILSSNTCYWQMRLEPGHRTGQPHRTIVAYKENAQWHDPLYTDPDPSNDHLVTTRWRNVPVSRPEASLLGTMYIEGDNPINDDYVFEDADAWLTENTSLATGSSLVGVAGYEVDGLSSSSPAGIRIIARMRAGRPAGAVTIYRAASGALVFATGSMQWSWGLDDYNAPRLRTSVLNSGVQQITRNVLARLARAND